MWQLVSHWAGVEISFWNAVLYIKIVMSINFQMIILMLCTDYIGWHTMSIQWGSTEFTLDIYVHCPDFPVRKKKRSGIHRHTLKFPYTVYVRFYAGIDVIQMSYIVGNHPKKIREVRENIINAQQLKIYPSLRFTDNVILTHLKFLF